MSHKPQSVVEGWLAIATRDLCVAAKERIGVEITAHFDEAVAGHVAEGLTDRQAKTAAIQELGDANEAAKRFRGKHLTKKEYQFVYEERITLRFKRSPIRLACFTLGFGILLGCLWKFFTAVEIYWWVGMFSLSQIIELVWSRLVPSWPVRTSVRQLTMLLYLRAGFLLIAMVSACCFTRVPKFILIIVLAQTFNEYFKWFKVLRKVEMKSGVDFD